MKAQFQKIIVNQGFSFIAKEQNLPVSTVNSIFIRNMSSNMLFKAKAYVSWETVLKISRTGILCF